MTTDEINKRLGSFESAYTSLEEKIARLNGMVKELGFVDRRVYEIEKNVIKLLEDVSLLKTNSIVRTKVSTSNPSTMTPFASRMNNATDLRNIVGGPK